MRTPIASRTAGDIGIRNIRPDDLALMQQFVRSLSRETSYRRLMSPRTPTQDELRHWTEVDPARERALVAVTVGAGAEAMAGVARYVIEGNGDAEFAIVVTDAFQGQGLGRALLERLIRAAKADGLRRLKGITLSENIAMRSLAQSLGFKASRTPGSAIETTLALSLDS
jgi:acetyltransferase